MRNDNKRLYCVFVVTALIFLFLPKSHFSSSPLVKENPLHSVQKTAEREFGIAGEFNSSKTHFSRKAASANLQTWIDVDLQPWNITGITKRMVDLAAQQGMRANRIQIIDGKIYAQISKSSRGPSRIWYWLWGLMELIDDFPSEDIPNVDFVLNTQDDPQVPVVGKRPKNPILAKNYRDYVPGIEGQAPPPVFSAVTTSNHYDLLWPLWTIWGEDVEGAGSKTGGFHDPPWKELHPKLIHFAKKNKWSERRSERIFWRGSVKTNPARRALIRCSKNTVDAADVQHKLRVGKPIDALDRVKYKYLIYLDGKSFSSAVLPMLVAGAVVFLPNNSPFQTLCQRAFRENGFHQVFHVSLSQGEICRTLSEILSGLRNEEVRVENRAKDAVDWAETQLSMLAFQKYMIAMLKRYADLLKYTPTKTKDTVEISWKLIKKNVKRKQ